MEFDDWITGIFQIKCINNDKGLIQIKLLFYQYFWNASFTFYWSHPPHIFIWIITPLSKAIGAHISYDLKQQTF